ncbi:MAG TPA: metallophosphoesterase [Herpetosiphonaceae bacterium]|nr:metallophosphoesterase [Herpetosiphonaceae bacterium]
MRILTLSDEVAREVYGPSAQERFQDVDLILACGDLPPSYLEFAVSVLNVPCFYVHGNHDARPEVTEAGATVEEPGGCTSIEGRLKRIGGLSIAGLGGSPWYNGEAYQYTEAHMRLRFLRLLPRLLLQRQRDGHALDIMIAHAAPRGINDGPGPHRGFEVFRWMIDHLRPRYFIHGHVHPSYGYNRATDTMVGQTRVINTVGYRVLDVEPLASAVKSG